MKLLSNTVTPICVTGALSKTDTTLAGPRNNAADDDIRDDVVAWDTRTGTRKSSRISTAISDTKQTNKRKGQYTGIQLNRSGHTFYEASRNRYSYLFSLACGWLVTVVVVVKLYRLPIRWVSLWPIMERRPGQPQPRSEPL